MRGREGGMGEGGGQVCRRDRPLKKCTLTIETLCLGETL